MIGRTIFWLGFAALCMPRAPGDDVRHASEESRLNRIALTVPWTAAGIAGWPDRITDGDPAILATIGNHIFRRIPEMRAELESNIEDRREQGKVDRSDTAMPGVQQLRIMGVRP